MSLIRLGIFVFQPRIRSGVFVSLLGSEFFFGPLLVEALKPDYIFGHVVAIMKRSVGYCRIQRRQVVPPLVRCGEPGDRCTHAI